MRDGWEEDEALSLYDEGRSAMERRDLQGALSRLERLVGPALDRFDWLRGK